MVGNVQGGWEQEEEDVKLKTGDVVRIMPRSLPRQQRGADGGLDDRSDKIRIVFSQIM